MFRICSHLPALNALDPMTRRIDNRDSTLHLAAVWLRCINRRLIAAPAGGRPRDVIVSRQLRHLFADLNFADCFILTLRLARLDV